MPDEALVKLLREGTDRWNQWRFGGDNSEADLSDADLSNLKLSGVNLIKANLGRSNLANTDLRGASMAFAKLPFADLTGANLSEADLTETVTTLARLARLIIADITDASSVAHELQAIVPDLRSVPVQPLLEFSKSEYGMFADFLRSHPSVLKTYKYKDAEDVVSSFDEKIIAPAEAWLRQRNVASVE